MGYRPIIGDISQSICIMYSWYLSYVSSSAASSTLYNMFKSLKDSWWPDNYSELFQMSNSLSKFYNCLPSLWGVGVLNIKNSPMWMSGQGHWNKESQAICWRFRYMLTHSPWRPSPGMPRNINRCILQSQAVYFSERSKLPFAIASFGSSFKQNVLDKDNSNGTEIPKRHKREVLFEQLSPFVFRL